MKIHRTEEEDYSPCKSSAVDFTKSIAHLEQFYKICADHTLDGSYSTWTGDEPTNTIVNMTRITNC